MTDNKNKITTSQTIGPFSHEAWQWAADMTVAAASPDRITISGTIFDGDGLPINDAQIEAWIPDAVDHEANRPMPGFRRTPSALNGSFSLSAPARAAAGEPLMYVTIFARGLVKHQFTAIFLDDDPGLAQSALLEQVPGGRRRTLIASKLTEGRYSWDIWMQGEKETAFFDYT